MNIQDILAGLSPQEIDKLREVLKSLPDPEPAKPKPRVNKTAKINFWDVYFSGATVYCAKCHFELTPKELEEHQWIWHPHNRAVAIWDRRSVIPKVVTKQDSTKRPFTFRQLMEIIIDEVYEG